MGGIEASTIMVIGSDARFNYLLQRYVRKSGCRAVVSRPSPQALAMAQQERPQAILLEIEQGDVTGWDLLSSLKADGTTQNVPVIVCSWLEHRERCLAEGAERHLQKPVLYGDFVAALVDVGVLDAV
jgi:CheY-like chemotaxis protein